MNMLAYDLLIPIIIAICTNMLAMRTRSKFASLVVNLMAFLFIAAICVVALTYGQTFSFSGFISISHLSLLFILLFASSFFLVSLISYGQSRSYTSLSMLLWFSMLGGSIVASSINMMPIVIGLELITVSSAFMILLDGRHRAEATIKFFIVGSIAASFFLFAMALVFPYDPSLGLSIISGNSEYVALAAIMLFIAALGFEGAIFPFNFWVPDVYEGAPGFVTPVLSGINKKVAFLALILVLFTAFSAYVRFFSPLLAVLAVVTMTVGNLLAIVQKRVKRMFAYSSISQAGYILVGLAVGTQMGISASIFYIFAHALMIIGAFAVVMVFESANMRTIEDYRGAYASSPLFAVALTILMLSMAGIPPLIGFFGKFLLFSSAIYSGVAILAVIGIINSFISVVYYSRIIDVMFSGTEKKTIRATRTIALAVIAIVVAIIIFGVYPQPLISAIHSAVAQLPIA